MPDSQKITTAAFACTVMMRSIRSPSRLHFSEVDAKRQDWFGASRDDTCCHYMNLRQDYIEQLRKTDK